MGCVARLFLSQLNGRVMSEPKPAQNAHGDAHRKKTRSTTNPKSDISRLL